MVASVDAEARSAGRGVRPGGTDQPITTATSTGRAASQRAEHADDPAYPAAGDQQDAPAGQHDQRQRAPASGHARSSVVTARDPPPHDAAGDPRLVAGHGGQARAGQPDQRRPARRSTPQPLSRRARAAGRSASSTSASKQVRSPVWQAGPSWSTLTSSVSPSQSSRTSLTHCAVAGGLALDPVLLAATGSSTSPARWSGSGPAPRRPSSPASAPRRCRAAGRPPAPARRRRASAARRWRGRACTSRSPVDCPRCGSTSDGLDDGSTSRSRDLLGHPGARAARRRRRRGRRTSSACGPRWTTRPRSTTTTSSAFSAVESRCAMVTEVRPRHQPLEGPADPHLERRVDGAGGLVEDQQVGVGQVGAQQGDQLALAGRQRLAALADAGVEAARAGRPASRRGRARRALARMSASVGVELAVAHVGGDRVVEEEALLRHQHDAAPQRDSARSARTSTPSSRTAPVDRVHQPGEQLGEGGLARAGLADDRDPACRRRCRGRRRAAPAARPGRRR